MAILLWEIHAAPILRSAGCVVNSPHQGVERTCWGISGSSHLPAVSVDLFQEKSVELSQVFFCFEGFVNFGKLVKDLVERYQLYAWWWQLKYVFGMYILIFTEIAPIWLSHIFVDGLMKNHQLISMVWNVSELF